jgi:hypothetical protein
MLLACALTLPPVRTKRDIAIVGASLIPGTPTEAFCSRKVFGFGTGLKRAGRRKLHHTGLLSQPESSAHILQANGYRLYLGRNTLSGTGITLYIREVFKYILYNPNTSKTCKVNTICT